MSLEKTLKNKIHKIEQQDKKQVQLNLRLRGLRTKQIKN